MRVSPWELALMEGPAAPAAAPDAAEAAQDEPENIESEEPVNVKLLRAPTAPTEEEVEIHESGGHPNFRSWCRACVAGAARNSQHRALDRTDVAIPTLHADYAFMGEKDETEERDARCMPILVLKIDKDRYIHAHAVPAKGLKHPWGARKLADAMVQNDFPRMIVKTDQEPAILDVKREALKIATEEAGIEGIPEESQAYVSPTNGTAEQAVQAIERKVRTLKFAVEALHALKLPPNHVLLAWAVEFAGQIESRMHKYTGDGRTAFELRRGEPYRRKLPPFGEKVSAITLGKKKMK